MNTKIDEKTYNYLFLNNFLKKYFDKDFFNIKDIEKYNYSFCQYPIAFNKYPIRKKIKLNSNPFIHIRKESYSYQMCNSDCDCFKYFNTHRVNLGINYYGEWNGDDKTIFIDCIDEKYDLYNPIRLRVYIPWLTISLCNNKYDPKLLLLPLKKIYYNKSSFCDFLFTNLGEGTPATNNYYKDTKIRYNFYKLLDSKRKVDRPTDNNRRNGNLFDGAINLHKPYRFNIAFENSIKKGWITEKILNAFLAGCIPIYRGDDYIYKFFNKKAIINANDFDSMESLSDYVIKVDNDKELYESYINQPPCTKENLKNILKHTIIKI